MGKIFLIFNFFWICHALGLRNWPEIYDLDKLFSNFPPKMQLLTSREENENYLQNSSSQKNSPIQPIKFSTFKCIDAGVEKICCSAAFNFSYSTALTSNRWTWIWWTIFFLNTIFFICAKEAAIKHLNCCFISS